MPNHDLGGSKSQDLGWDLGIQFFRAQKWFRYIARSKNHCLRRFKETIINLQRTQKQF